MFDSKNPSMHPIARAFAWAVLPAIAGLGLWACESGDEDHDEATVEIVTPADGSTVTGPAVKLRSRPRTSPSPALRARSP
jgi:hypothetical protein